MTTSTWLTLSVFQLSDLLADKYCQQLFWDDLASKICAYVKYLFEGEVTDFEPA